MRVAYCSEELSTTAIARRLVDEGAQVLLFTPREKDGKLATTVRGGEGIVLKATSLEQWLAWGSSDPNTVWFFDCTGSGKLADRLRAAGKLVVGGSEVCDKLENDRAFGSSVAQAAGMQIPPTREFSSVSAVVGFLRGKTRQLAGDGGWAWKSNRWLSADANYCGEPDDLIRHLGHIIARFGDRIACVLQERIDGTPLSTSQWFNGTSFVGPIEGTLEHKRAWDGELGPSTGCAYNLLWYYREPAPPVAVSLQWDAFEAQLRKHRAPPGIYDINAVVNGSGAWFLEHTPRLGIDSELTGQRGIESYLELLTGLAHGGYVDALFDVDSLYADTRLSVPPYPNDVHADNTKLSAVGTPLHGLDGLWKRYFVAAGVMRTGDALVVSDPGGFIGCAVGSGQSLDGIYDGIYKYLKSTLKVANLQYRTDCVEYLQQDLYELSKVGYDLHPLLKEEGVSA